MSHEILPSDEDRKAAFDAWLQGLLSVRLAFRWENGHWFVLAEDFDITGMGATQEEAFRDMTGLLAAYLLSHFRDGTPFEQTKRPIPLRLKLEIRRDILLRERLGKRAVKEHRSHEAQTFLPADFVRSAAIC